MPELPEVETSRRGIAPLLEGRRVIAVRVRQRRLRWPVPAEIDALVGQTIARVERRAKYLLLQADRGWVILHLGMSGSLRILPAEQPPGKHDHLDMVLEDGAVLRFNDPRRFGAWLWTEQPLDHPLLARLGPEPLSDAFDGAYLQAACDGRQKPIKLVLMDNHIVVGVGNIYANEALFAAGIDPRRPAGRISARRLARLVTIVKQVLSRAIEQGGTTLRDFTRTDGRPGYFAQQLQVYGRGGEPCRVCRRPLRQLRLGQRTTVFCSHCQR